MLKVQNSIASFVLRFTQELWRDDNGEPHVQWRGHIRHVQGDEEDRFTDFAEAVSFIQRYLTQLTLEALAGGQSMSQEKVLRESFKVWEQFASSYADLMFEAMQRTVKQSEAFRDQLDQATERALKVWHLPTQPNQGQLVEEIRLLQAQVQALTTKVENLEKTLQARTHQE
ncbi:MAG: hypothetical protein HYR94_30625 [Chloroflexi bacterium]|nr:hypothetical protein [Chloroflexota bacterium]